MMWYVGIRECKTWVLYHILIEYNLSIEYHGLLWFSNTTGYYGFRCTILSLMYIYIYPKLIHYNTTFNITAI